MYKSFDLLKKLYFVRTGGSQEELQAANILLDEVRKLGVEDARLEEFEVDGATIKEAKLSFAGYDKEIECVGVGYSGSTSKEGVSGQLCYIDSVASAKINDVKGKICLVHSKLVNYKVYEILAKKQASGLILLTGSVYDSNKDVDLDPYLYRQRHYKHGKIPAVCIRSRDGERLLRSNVKMAHLTLLEDEYQNKSHNVVAEIKGEIEDEVICFSAHYDSVSYSKGAYDNATGSTCIMQILAHFAVNKPKRTLRFIWCGSEEMGLLGSKAYVEKHQDELENVVLNINVDMIGVTIGNDIACATADHSVVSYINYYGLIKGFAIAAKQGVYSSDSTPFADKGVPAISFARIAPPTGAQIHSHKDVMDYLSKDNYYRTCNFIIDFVSGLVNAVAFPIEKNIPDNMKEEIDYYYGRKERKM